MKNIGIDVGGTNTDAVLVADERVVAAVKSPTTADVTSGVRNALAALIAQCPAALTPDAVMIGTTHFTNAVVQRRSLQRAAALRIGLPASATLPPFCDWPEDLAGIVDGGVHMVEGGFEFDGRELVPLDEKAVAQAARQIRADGIDTLAISGVFSPLNPAHELRAGDIVRNEHPDVHITFSHQLGRIGLMGRENVALLNATLIRLAHQTSDAFVAALAASGIQAPLFLTQNDGTVTRAENARDFPVYSFASGPTNSMRGAAFLARIDDAVVCDVGGTTSDVGCLQNGFPRQANNMVEVGGVRTAFRMPDLLSIGIGGGTIVQPSPLAVGPVSVGHRLTEAALVFGGDTLTLSDIATAAGIVEIGDTSRVAHLDAALVKTVMARVHAEIADICDRMKVDARPVPLIAVGGGSMLVPDEVAGFSSVVRVEHHAVANAVGAAIAQVSGEVDQIFTGLSREALLERARDLAVERAVAAGAERASISVIEQEDIPLAYLPGNAVRARVRVVGDIAGRAA
jgi:N-methylhydantoinase A/oxoprolinase/acetone carboxylase beta subunit